MVNMMDTLIAFVEKHFVIILLAVVSILLIRIMAKHLMNIVLIILAVILGITWITGDTSLLDKGVDSSSKIIDYATKEVSSYHINRTDEQHYTLTSNNVNIEVNEETKKATIKWKDHKSVVISVDKLYQSIEKETLDKIKKSEEEYNNR